MRPPVTIPPPAGASLLRGVLPGEVAWSEAFDDPQDVVTFPAEEAAISRAVPRRRREYQTVRHCAREALASLGLPPVPILSGEKREPLWPEGIVGSMTHCQGYRGAVVAAGNRVRSLGIDAEPHEPLPAGVLEQVATDQEHGELVRLADSVPGVHWDRLLFCAKEATYKAWFPLTGAWLGFSDANITIDPVDGCFASTLLVEGPVVDGERLRRMHGRWVVRHGLALTAIAVLARPGEA